MLQCVQMHLGRDVLVGHFSKIMLLCYRVLHCATMCCNVLQCVQMHDSRTGLVDRFSEMMRQCGVVCCSALQRVAVCCNAMQCVKMHLNRAIFVKCFGKIEISMREVKPIRMCTYMF